MAQIDHDAHVRILTHVADTISAFAIVGTFIKVLPPIAALAATLWYLVQVWESHTVQKWWRLHNRKRRTHAIRRHRSGVHKLMKPQAARSAGGLDDWHL